MKVFNQRIKPSRWSLVAYMAPLACTLAAQGEPAGGETPLTTVRVASGLDRPLYVTHAPNDFGRIFIVEQTGRIKILKNGELLPEPFLDIAAISLSGGERGLLGLAFHPDYPADGFFYVNYTDNLGDTVVARYRVSDDPDVADPESAHVVLTLDQPNRNHNGGWIDFGPDGYLYIATGDGGSQFDPDNRAQTITNELLGKILRIDVNGDDFPDDPDRNYAIPPDNPFVGTTGDDEIWAFGLRNPWRCAFDQKTADLYIADVGQDEWEELNWQSAASAGGENYGWRCMEGLECTELEGCACDDPSWTPPVHVYFHEDNRCSITGGEVYRGCAIADLQGTYFFADYCSNQIWSLRFDGVVKDFRERTKELAPGVPLVIDNVSSFGRDAFGEIYLCDQGFGSEVFKIVPAKLLPPPALADSIPPDGAIDAGQPSEPDGSNPAGRDSVDLIFDRCADGFQQAGFLVGDTSGEPDQPVVADVGLVRGDTVRVVLDRSIRQSEWTTIRRVETEEGITIGWLPGDVDESGVVDADDVGALIPALLDEESVRPLRSTDIDRSGRATPADLLRLLDIFHCADEYGRDCVQTLP